MNDMQPTPPDLQMYAHSVETEVRSVSLDSHTMGEKALARYARTKFSKEQLNVLRRAAREGVFVEVHGIYSGHASEALRRRGLELRRTYERIARPEKLFNTRRPVLHDCSRDGTRVLVYTVAPSPEYVDQHAEVVLTALRFYARERERKREGRPAYTGPVKVFHYPACEDTFIEWSRFAEGIRGAVRPGDICVMGEVALLSEFLTQQAYPIVQPFQDFGVEGIFAHQLHVSPQTQRRLLLVGARECYWGSAAARIAEALAEAGAGHVIYAAKCGTFVGTNAVHDIVCPVTFAIANYDRVNREHLPAQTVSLPPSGLRDEHVRLLPGEMSGLHLTVPTVIGETKQQRSTYKRYQPATIDNEIGYMAERLASWMRRTDRTVEFTALHFTTDYVTDGSRNARHAKVNLGVKGARVHRIKRERFRAITRIINNYANQHGVLADSAVGPTGLIHTLSSWSQAKAKLEALAENRLIDPREDVPLLLDGWVAAYYYGDMNDLSRIMGRILQRTDLTQEMLDAAALSQCAIEVMGLRGSDQAREERSVLRDRVVARLRQILASSDRRFVRAVCHDVIAMAALAASDGEASAAQVAREHLVQARDEMEASAAEARTRQVWQCFIAKFLGRALVGCGEGAAGLEASRAAEAGWAQILATTHPLPAWPRLFFEGERAIARLDCMKHDPAAREQWRPAVERHIADAERAFTSLSNVKLEYERTFGESWRPAPSQ